ncbi:MAG: S1 RNA-binding domain-containing protein [Chloroflexota bacterium]|nr:S1 RNA-binding domain-containing protein [Chloroflexota bacterium]
MNIETVTEQHPIIPDATDQGPADLPPAVPDVTGQSPADLSPPVPDVTDQSPADLPPAVPSATDQSPADLPPTDSGVAGQALSEYLTEYKAPRRGDIRSGVVMEINERGLVVDVGLKREGFVYADDLERLDEEARSEIQVGTTVSVLVIRPEDREGHPILSIHQANLHQDWIKAEEMMGKGELYEGEISGYNRGGLVVQFGKIRGFVPASQVVGLPRRLPEEERRRRLAEIVGQRFGLKIIEVDRRRRRLIFSQRRALRAWQELQRQRVMDELKEGEIRHGRVTDITSFGAFVDLGGADGLIHVSELSWSRVDDPHQVLKIGDEVDVYVLDLDRQRKRIALSLKKLQPDPWTLVGDHYQQEQLVEGRVTRVLDFGAFVELDIGVEGLLHASEMIGTPEFRPSDIVHPGETLLVKIIRIDSKRNRIALSARQVRQEEWEHWVAEQQETREAEDAEVSAAGEEEAVTPGAEVGGETEAETVAPETEVSAADEEKATVPEVEIGGETEAETVAPETEVSAADEEEAAAPSVMTEEEETKAG